MDGGWIEVDRQSPITDIADETFKDSCGQTGAITRSWPAAPTCSSSPKPSTASTPWSSSRSATSKTKRSRTSRRASSSPNPAWTVIAALAHNLLRWTSLIGLPGTVMPTARTIRRRLIASARSGEITRRLRLVG